jgi:quercetin dioxygenase-like cupin family protein/alkylhydroperoxidase/carboxymuconolactone decarboxylase family protein YurZ
MNKTIITSLAGLFIAVFGIVTVVEADAGEKGGLNARQEAIVPIATFTATGQMDQLKPALNQGLDAGLTVNEIKEVLVHIYAYAGFPRALNAINAFKSVMDDRKARGIKDKTGREATPLPDDFDKNTYGHKVRNNLVGRDISNRKSGYPVFTPIIDKFLVEHLFADIFARDILSHKQRELVTISTLAAMSGTEAQLKGHFQIAMRLGYSDLQLKDFITALNDNVGAEIAERANRILGEVQGKERAGTNSQKIVVTPTASLPPTQGPDDKFTGSVRINTRFEAQDPSHFYGANVVFDPGSRTAWHSHTLGQLLIVTSGTGLVQRRGDPAQKIGKGDVVWIPPYQKHWHGATPDTPMAHIAIVEQRDGPSVEWMEKVSDEQYEASISESEDVAE